MTDNPPAGIHPLRERLATAISEASATAPWYNGPEDELPEDVTYDTIATECNLHIAQAAVSEVADWLRDEAGDIEAEHDGDNGKRHRPIVKHLRWLADAIYPKEAHDGQ